MPPWNVQILPRTDYTIDLRSSTVMPLRIALIALALALPAQRSSLAPTGSFRGAFIASNPVQGRVDAATGAVTGPAADLIRELARRIGAEAVVLPVPDAGAVIDSVRSGRADVGFLAVDPERAAQVDFSDPYSNSGAAYAVRADSRFRTSEDVDQPNVRIGVITGQTPGVYVQEHLKRARVESLPDVPPNAAIGRMLLDGRFDAFAANRTRMEELARDVSGLRVLDDDYMVTNQAIVVRKGNAAALAEINRFLADVRGSGFVKASLERANIAGVRVAPGPTR
jgi:polar amino acid transport system substrate-binding protein